MRKCSPFGLVISLGVIPLVGCSGDDSALVSPSSHPQENVLVIDDGIDPASQALKRRAAGRYTITCRQDPPSSAPPPADFEEAKSRALASLQNRDDRCHLTDGIPAKPDPLASIAHYRDRWNEMVRRSQFGMDQFTQAEFQEITDALDSLLPNARYHGTATSSVITHDNADVRLVLIEELLGSATTAMQNFKCIEQADIDRSVALMSDADVREAMIHRPSSTIEDEINGVVRQYAVGVINESFGPFTRQTLEQLQTAKGCAPVELRRYFALQAEISQARAQAQPDADALLVKSAGNEHVQMDTTEDASVCAGTSGQRLVVGAYDLTGQLASFTNFGACVDAFAPGVSVIGTIPGDWLMPVSGTSFSAPLVARMVSLDAASPYSTGRARDAVLGANDGTQRVPMARFPRSIFYDPQRMLGPQSLAARQELPTAADGPRISERKLNEILLPLALGR